MSSDLQFKTKMIISHNFVGIMAAKHGPAVSVIPVFIPLNPYCKSLFLLYKL
jgi:hypothetical protein